MKLDLIDLSNEKVGELEISDDVFLESPNEGLVHQYLMLQHTRPCRKASTKTKSEVRGGGAKPWKQKGTGRARAGSIRSPLWKGGGVIFGPKPHEISFKMPKRARLKALCSALTMKKDELLVLNEYPVLSAPKTKEAISVLSKLPLQEKKVLAVFDFNDSQSEALKKSLSNLDNIRIIDWRHFNVHDFFNANATLMDQKILKNIESWLLTRKNRKGVKSEEGAVSK